jgi:DNA invertase Pin-like site-specific DNA recombinase
MRVQLAVSDQPHALSAAVRFGGLGRRYVLVAFDDCPLALLSHADGSGLLPEARPKLTALSWEEIRLALMRVSKSDGSQTIDLQRDALIGAGVDPAQIYEYRAAGRLDARPGLDAMLKALRTGDTLVVWKLDRLGRNLRHLVNTVHDLTKQGVGFKVLTGHGASIDTTTPAGKLVFGIFAALSEFERELISERTRAGLASARARGRKGGAPFKMTVAKVRLAMAAMGKPKTKVGDLCRELGVTRQTLYRHVSPAGNLREDGRKLLETNPYRSPHWLML